MSADCGLPKHERMKREERCAETPRRGGRVGEQTQDARRARDRARDGEDALRPELEPERRRRFETADDPFDDRPQRTVNIAWRRVAVKREALVENGVADDPDRP